MGDHAINKIFTLGNAEFPVSWENEIKLWTFLETRAALLLKTYKTTSEVRVRPFSHPIYYHGMLVMILHVPVSLSHQERTCDSGNGSPARTYDLLK